MEILYCIECGSMVPPAEAAKGNYRLVDDEPVCAGCYRKIVKERGEVGVAPGEVEEEVAAAEFAEPDGPDVPAPEYEEVAEQVEEPEPPEVAKEVEEPEPPPEPEPEPQPLPEDLPDLPPQLAAQLQMAPPGSGQPAPAAAGGGGGRLAIFISLGVGALLLLGIIGIAIAKRGGGEGNGQPPTVTDPAPVDPPGPVSPPPPPDPDPTPGPAPDPTPTPQPPKPPPPGAKIKAIRPEADTYVKQGKAAPTRYGNGKGLAVSAQEGSPRVAYFRFDLKAFAKERILNARLRLTVTAAPRHNKAIHAVYFVADDKWQETAVLWDKKPKRSEKLGELQPRRHQAVEVEITDAVRREAAGDGKLSLCVAWHSGDATRGATYASREFTVSKHRPALLIACE